MTKLASRVLGSALALTLTGVQPATAQLGPGAAGRAPYAYQPSPRNEAGRFDYYSMVLSWSPTYCATTERPGDPQCRHRGERAYSFVLHGLWPQHDRGWPESCPTLDKPFVPKQTIDKMLDIMPSPNLVIHEYRKHGTCSGLSADTYFELSRKLYSKIKVPPRYDGPNQAFSVSPAEIIKDFVGANPATKTDNYAVVCNGPGNRLKEVRVCFSREGEPRSCGRNEEPHRLCQSNKVYIPPVRIGDRASQASPGPR